MFITTNNPILRRILVLTGKISAANDMGSALKALGQMFYPTL
mgnify:CR=1 FL=1